ncbi:hypothetical protein TNCV_567761 [Trichonephila clavipes]|nr:hypothetical protein TNCV_567761 [Trichonephila clavipes]
MSSWVHGNTFSRRCSADRDGDQKSTWKMWPGSSSAWVDEDDMEITWSWHIDLFCLGRDESGSSLYPGTQHWIHKYAYRTSSWRASTHHGVQQGLAVCRSSGKNQARRLPEVHPKYNATASGRGSTGKPDTLICSTNPGQYLFGDSEDEVPSVDRSGLTPATRLREAWPKGWYVDMMDLRSTSRVLRPRQFQEIKEVMKSSQKAPRKEPELKGLGDRSSIKLSSLCERVMS